MLTHLIKSVIRNEKGQGMVEYGLILALVVVGAVVAFTSIGTGLTSTLTEVAGKLTK